MNMHGFEWFPAKIVIIGVDLKKLWYQNFQCLQWILMRMLDKPIDDIYSMFNSYDMWQWLLK